MDMTKPLQQEYEHFNHRRLWATAQAQIDIIPVVPGYKATHFQIAAILLMYFAFEGFLNWLLSIAAPETWAQEKEFFQGDRYKGTFGKCCYLLELLKISDYAPNERPVNTVREIQALRRCLVHAKPERGTRNVTYDSLDGLPVHVGQIDRRTHRSLVDRVHSDFETLANRMHRETQTVLGIELGSAEPFSPLLGIQRTETESAEQAAAGYAQLLSEIEKALETRA